MTTIQSTFPAQVNTFPVRTPNAAPSSNDEDPKKVVIEITPGEENVSSGDLSGNTAQISITTPENELEFEVSREQVFNAVERRTYKNILQQPSGNRSLRNAALAQQLDDGDLASLAYLNVKQSQIDTYSQATQNNPYTGSSQDSSSSTDSVQKYNEAKNAYMKQVFVFSTIDRLGISERV